MNRWGVIKLGELLMRLQDKVAIITGAASGIGRASAQLFAKEGASVVAVDLNEEGGKETVESIARIGGQALFLKADVSRSQDSRNMIDTAVDRHGGLDVLFNNAGTAVFKSLLDHEEEDWDRVLNVNLKAIFLASKYAVPHMLKRQGGSIINTASVHGFATGTFVTSYAASKAGVIGLTRAIALEHARDNIRVNCILPGAVETPQMRTNLRAMGDEEEQFENISQREPVGRVGRPEEIAKAALFLASDESSFATGAPFIIDGGLLAQLV